MWQPIIKYITWYLVCFFLNIWFVSRVVSFRTQKQFDWGTVWWRSWLPRDVASHLAAVVISHQTECPYVGRMMRREPFVRWWMLPATRRSCVAHLVRTATVDMVTSVSLHMDQPNFEQPSVIRATRPNSAKRITQLASVPMVQGSKHFVVSLFVTSRCLFSEISCLFT